MPWNFGMMERRLILISTSRIEKITDEIEKMKGKITNLQARLRDLERQRTEMENADIIAVVRSMDITPDKLAAFIQMYKEQHNNDGGAVPNLPVTTAVFNEKTENVKEANLIED